MNKNEGIIMHGGAISGKNIATGQNAVAAEFSGGDAVLKQRIDELIVQLREHASQLPDAPEVISAAENLAREVAQPVPSRITVKGLLSGIAEAAKSVTTVTAAVEAVRALALK